MGAAGSPCFIRLRRFRQELPESKVKLYCGKVAPVRSTAWTVQEKLPREVSLMREMRVVYNPKARRGRFISRVDSFIEQAQKRDFRLSFYRLSGNREDAGRILRGLQEDAVVVACGGDGTVQLVVDAMVQHELDLPMGVLPYGTSNDFADSIGLTTDSQALLEYIESDNIGLVDVGKIGDRCFINVFSAGQIIKASHEVERTYKDHLGMLAYYLHSVGQLPRIAPFPVTLRGDIQERFSCLLLVVLNSTNAGGFRNLAPMAHLGDGYLDLIAVRECSISEMAAIFLGALRGEHQRHPDVLYAKVRNLEVYGPTDMVTDIDGERGPALPVHIQVLPRRIRLLGARHVTS